MDIRQVQCARETRLNARGEIRLGDSCRMDLSGYWHRVSCVYIDPPYMTGERFILRQRVGEEGWRSGRRFIDLPAYTDRWPDRSAYLEMIRNLVRQSRQLLTEEGALFVHVDTRVDGYVRVLLDDLLGGENLVNQLIWAYQSGGRSKNHYSRKHDVIYFYRMSPKLKFDITRVPVPRGGNRQNQRDERIKQDQLHIHKNDLRVSRPDCFHRADLPHLVGKDSCQRVICQRAGKEHDQNTDHQQDPGEHDRYAHDIKRFHALTEEEDPPQKRPAHCKCPIAVRD